MEQTIPRHLVDQFFAIVDEGNEEKARKFLLEHLKEFPEESQNAIITAFVEEALAKTADADALMATLRNEGIDTARAISSSKKEAERQEKLEGLKENL